MRSRLDIYIAETHAQHVAGEFAGYGAGPLVLRPGSAESHASATEAFHQGLAGFDRFPPQHKGAS